MAANVLTASVRVRSATEAPIRFDFELRALRVGLFARESINRLGEDWTKPGVYVLLGAVGATGKTTVYVGKAVDVRGVCSTTGATPRSSGGGRWLSSATRPTASTRRRSATWRDGSPRSCGRDPASTSARARLDSISLARVALSQAAFDAASVEHLMRLLVRRAVLRRRYPIGKSREQHRVAFCRSCSSPVS